MARGRSLLSSWVDPQMDSPTPSSSPSRNFIHLNTVELTPPQQSFDENAHRTDQRENEMRRLNLSLTKDAYIEHLRKTRRLTGSYHTICLYHQSRLRQGIEKLVEKEQEFLAIWTVVASNIYIKDVELAVLTVWIRRDVDEAARVFCDRLSPAARQRLEDSNIRPNTIATIMESRKEEEAALARAGRVVKRVRNKIVELAKMRDEMNQRIKDAKDNLEIYDKELAELEASGRGSVGDRRFGRRREGELQSTRHHTGGTSIP